MISNSIDRIVLNRPRDTAELFGWVQAVLGVDVPFEPVCDGHVSPLLYLDHVFFERDGDALVWANRGGGKTYYGAVATLLDMIFKPGISIRILGGSLDQSQRMYEHLRHFLERPGLGGMRAGRASARRLRLINGSEVELLCHSQTSVRGCRVQKLRCDEVDQFEKEVWTAAQFVTQSKQCGDTLVRGTVEALSTIHKQAGLMRQLVDEARGSTGLGPVKGSHSQDGCVTRNTGFQPVIHSQDGCVTNDGRGTWKLFEWCVLDVMARCFTSEHSCEGCVIAGPCGSRARRFFGFVPVSDVLGIRNRTTAESFGVEMLCRQEVMEGDRVYGGFDPSVHVEEFEPAESLPWVCGMDFGHRGQTVVLWAQVWRRKRDDWSVRVFDEHVGSKAFIEHYVEVIRRQGWPEPCWLGVDPSGKANTVNGLNAVEQLRRAGFSVRTQHTRVDDGVDVIRRMLHPSQGRPRLLVHRRCRTLIGALLQYHYNPRNKNDDVPVKDGPDHACDALRYLVVNLFGGGEVTVREY